MFTFLSPIIERRDLAPLTVPWASVDMSALSCCSLCTGYFPVSGKRFLTCTIDRKSVLFWLTVSVCGELVSMQDQPDRGTVEAARKPESWEGMEGLGTRANPSRSPPVTAFSQAPLPTTQLCCPHDPNAGNIWGP